MEVLQFLLAPFAASLILTGIHAYLGVHVVERGVIFVDLSLAQIAALGGTIALVLPISGGDAHGPAVYWVSLSFTFLGAAVFAFLEEPPRADSARGDYRNLLRGGFGGRHPRHEQSDFRERASQGHARRKHSGRQLVGGRQDGCAIRRRSGSFTTSFGTTFCSSP